MDVPEIILRLEKIESSLLSLFQEARSMREEIHKTSDQNLHLEPLLSAEKVAEILGVDKAYIYTQARSGKMPSIKLGKYRRFSPSKIKKWLDRKNGALL